MNVTELVKWINELIKCNDIHAFYVSPIWRKKQKEILKKNHYECSRCKAKGKVTRACTVHHIKYLRKYPQYALDDDNLEPICKECHYAEHHKTKKKFVNVERW